MRRVGLVSGPPASRPAVSVSCAVMTFTFGTGRIMYGLKVSMIRDRALAQLRWST